MIKFFVRIVDSADPTPDAVSQHEFHSIISRRIFLDGLPLSYRELATWEENVPETQMIVHGPSKRSTQPLNETQVEGRMRRNEVHHA